MSGKDLRRLALLNDDEELSKGRQSRLLQFTLLRGDTWIVEEESVAGRVFHAEVDNDSERSHQFCEWFCRTLTDSLELVCHPDEIGRGDGGH